MFVSGSHITRFLIVLSILMHLTLSSETFYLMYIKCISQGGIFSLMSSVLRQGFLLFVFSKAATTVSATSAIDKYQFSFILLLFSVLLFICLGNVLILGVSADCSSIFYYILL